MWAKIPSIAKTWYFLQNPAHLSILSVLHKDSQRLGLISEPFCKCKCGGSSLGRTGLFLSHASESMCIYRTRQLLFTKVGGENFPSNGKVFGTLPSPSPFFIHLKLRKSNPTLPYLMKVSPDTQTKPTEWKLLCSARFCSTVPLHSKHITPCNSSCDRTHFQQPSSLEPSHELRELSSCQVQPMPGCWPSSSPSSLFVGGHKYQLLLSCCSALTKVFLKTSVLVGRENNTPPPTE